MKAKVLEIFRHGGRIGGYRILCSDGKVWNVASEILKGYIRSGELEVVNLTLTKDSRLVTKNPTVPNEMVITKDIMYKVTEMFKPKGRLYWKFRPCKNIEETNSYCVSHGCRTMEVKDGVLVAENEHNLVIFMRCKKIVMGDSWVQEDIDKLGEFAGVFSHLNASIMDLTQIDFSKVKNMYNMFANSYDLGLIIFPDMSNTVNLENMEGMFYFCHNLEVVNLETFNTSNVKNMQGMFYNCKKLDSRRLNIKNWDTRKLEDTRYMFFNCEGLKHLDMSGWNLSSIKNAESMFCDCRNLESIDFGTSKLKKGTYAREIFKNCTSLRKEITPGSVRQK